jgi:hypothetical protein
MVTATAMLEWRRLLEVMVVGDGGDGRVRVCVRRGRYAVLGQAVR